MPRNKGFHKEDAVAVLDATWRDVGDIHERIEKKLRHPIARRAITTHLERLVAEGKAEQRMWANGTKYRRIERAAEQHALPAFSDAERADMFLPLPSPQSTKKKG